MNTVRDHLLLYVNGARRSVSGPASLGSLAGFLRGRLGLRGTKRFCDTGDCGACSVLVGRAAHGEPIRYRPLDACITALHQVDATHVVTVEGLGTPHAPSPLQRALVEGHGSQCGACTPGMVVALTGLLERSDAPGEADFREALTGNLCRCTGYVQILSAARALGPGALQPLADRFPAPAMRQELDRCAGDEVRIEIDAATPVALWLPRRLDRALELLAAHPDARLVAGGTAPAPSSGLEAGRSLLSLQSIPELEGVERRDGGLVCGAGTRLAQLRDDVRDVLPQLADLIGRVGAPQIRELATLGGQLMSGSPTADLVPFLLASDAKLELLGTDGSRLIPLADLLAGEPQARLRAGELLARIAFPLLGESERLHLYKVARRRDLDTATLVLAMRLRIEGDTLREPRVACGGAGPRVLRLRATESELDGRPWSEASLRAAGAVARNELPQTTDARGSADYRTALVENLLLKAYHEHARVAR